MFGSNLSFVWLYAPVVVISDAFRCKPAPRRQMHRSVVTSAESIILVINRGESAARNLKDLIEFMDTPHVQIAAPEEWQTKLGERRLEALFVGPDMTDKELDRLLNDIGEFDPNVPIVMLSGGEAA